MTITEYHDGGLQQYLLNTTAQVSDLVAAAPEFQQVFVIAGCRMLNNDLLGLTALTIAQGTALQQDADYTRIKVSVDGSLELQSG